MANVRLQPHDPFNFRNPDEWPRWKQWFEQFRSASGLTAEDDLRQVSTLLYHLGAEVDDVLTSTNVSADDRKVYNSVVAKFNEFFKVRKNTIFERARFNQRNQLAGESAEQYITTLYSLVESCEYGDLKDETMSERPQMHADLTLEKAKKLVRQREAVQEQHLLRQGGGSKKDPIVLDEVKGQKYPVKKGGAKPHPKKAGIRSQAGNHSASANSQCKHCGREHHSADRCPARNATCHKCNRKGHYSAQCLSKTVAAAAHELCLDAAFLGTVVSKQESSWTIELLLGNKQIPFKLDTGAEVTAISEEAYRTLQKVSMQSPSKALFGPTCHSLKVLGQFTGTLKHQQLSSAQPIFVASFGARSMRNWIERKQQG